MLGLRFLGEVEVLRDGERAVLPPSRKTRALLAYLAATAKPHRRDRLCAMFWNVPDDPRGALRWSLSRLRGLVDEPGLARIVATRDTVAFEPHGADIDLAAVRHRVSADLPALGPDEMQELAAAFRGEFLEGIDMPDLPDFQAWCIAEREDLRRLQARILSMLVGALAQDPERALPHARELVKVDPFNEPARASLLQILIALGRNTEAERHFESAQRVFKELGRDAEYALQQTWRRLRDRPHGAAESARDAVDVVAAPAAAAPASPSTPGLVGREAERRRLAALLDASASRCHAVLVSGEPGLGKTRLLAELIGEARRRGIAVFTGHCLETDRGRPYAPWTEALGGLRLAHESHGATTEADRAALRRRLFEDVAAQVLTKPAVLVLDDVHWCDEVSADLLQQIMREGRERPLMVALAARSGELPDNPAVHALLRGLRHAQSLEEIRLAPLPAREVAALVQAAVQTADAALIAAHSGGNPLYALEMARANARNAADMASSLKQLVRDRIAQLPANAADALTWASILGPAFPLERLARIVPLRIEELTAALELLERHELLRATPGAYRFAHDLVHRAVYTDLSEPRRRLMHLKAARALQETGATDEAIAADVAHHAALGGDAGMAAAACVTAGRHCLRLLANAGAETLARRGLHYAEMLAEPERSQRMLELIEVDVHARRPADLAQAIARIEALAERALDLGSLAHARLGFHMLSHLRWEGGSWADAQRDTLRAEFLSRSGDEAQQVQAMAEAARCLAMLERDLGQAEALALEARALAQRLRIEPNAIADALGLLRLHQGAIEEAAEHFQHARDTARREGDRASEFLALEHLVGLEIQCRRYQAAERRCAELVALSEKLRDGSEAPCAHALLALCRIARGDANAPVRFAAAAAALRAADAKYRLGFALICAAEIDLEHGRFGSAREQANEALQLVTVLGRASEIAAAHALLARLAAVDADRKALQQHVAAMHGFLATASCWAQTFADAAFECAADPPARSRPVRLRTPQLAQS